MTYNVENLFDDIDNGTEYPDYDPGEGEWNTKTFHAKLANLAEVLRSAGSGGADLVALQEIENENALRILNESYLNGMGYRHIVLSQDQDTAVRVAFLSRLSIKGVWAHRAVIGELAPTRSVLEIEIEHRGSVLHLLNCHWKSKSGGAAATEPVRLATSELVVRRIREILDDDGEAGIILLGDLNEQIDEYRRAGSGYQTALIPVDAVVPASYHTGSIFVATEVKSLGGSSGKTALFSPWLETEAPGSYAYRNAWERIDHVLLSPGLLDETGLRFEAFEVVSKPFMVGPEGFPLRWNTDRASGYSDHLPLLLRLH